MFRNLRGEVKAYVESCKCQSANPANPTPPLKLRPLPQEPWKIVYCDYKGPISPLKYYVHTMMDGYSRYPEVYITKSEKLTELKRCINRSILTHGRPDEIWMDGGPPYNAREWETWTKHWGAKAKKTTPYHPPANGMVERFNQNLKLVILAAYTAGHDPKEEIDKYVAAYGNTPHTTTGEKPSKLMFNRDIETKLLRIPTTSRGRHHERARKKDREAKEKAKGYYDAKHRTRQEEIKEGDRVYRRNRKPTTTKGP